MKTPTFSASVESIEEIIDIPKSRHSRGIEDLLHCFLSQYFNSLSASHISSQYISFIWAQHMQSCNKTCTFIHTAALNVYKNQCSRRHKMFRQKRPHRIPLIRSALQKNIFSVLSDVINKLYVI